MVETTNLDLRDLLNAYAQLVQVLSRENDSRLDSLAASLTTSLAQTKSIIEGGITPKMEKKIIRGLRQGLRELPLLLSSIVPQYLEIIERLETNVGRPISSL